MKYFLIPILLIISACADQYEAEQFGRDLGTIVGGAVGVKVTGGNGQALGAAGGALLGGYAGAAIVRNMNERDKELHQQASEAAYEIPVGEDIAWENPESGNSGAITPTKEGTDTSGNYCREFQQTITIDGETQRAYGTACRQADGSWQIVN